MIKYNLKSVTAFAPATCANIAVGFDILGFAIDSVGDFVTLTKREDQKIIIEQIEGINNLPYDILKNTASVVIKKLCDDLQLNTGFNIRLKKGIALGSGMGGSSASSVAALVALNQFLLNPLTLNELAYYALFGEEIACGQRHADNIVPCLFGGMQLILSSNPIENILLPAPNIFCVLIHPHLRLDTKDARDILSKEISLKQHIQQSANLAGFITGIYKKDSNLLKKYTQDIIIEPQRAKLVPGFYKVKDVALQSGAIVASFSGSGPSLFALSDTKNNAEIIADKMQQEFMKYNIHSDFWITGLNSKGAHVTEIYEG
ncbi:homoserine kinase [Silvanigrella aquatica]|uniref:Homoserine kinase n=1 Tax=Silvanigrella aquatica TaxID=1915309 RepID=A0A1L4D0G9_9BACT|nr:homoserine kinase [Silvanigrella aquatica]APJ03703.1 homoserine kinase [Silvanigrella aquatica]